MESDRFIVVDEVKADKYNDLQLDAGKMAAFSY